MAKPAVFRNFGYPAGFPTLLIFVLRLVSYKRVAWRFNLFCLKGV